MRLRSIVSIIWRFRSLFSPVKLSIGPKAGISGKAIIVLKNGEIRIGRNLRMHAGALIDAQKGTVIVGDNVSLNHYAILYGAGNITIGNNVRIAAHTVIVSFDHKYQDVDRAIVEQGLALKPIVIGDDVWIGAGAKILGGTKIANGCVIGANSVLKGETEPNGIYVGSPARLVKHRG